ncbi:MAG: acyl-CoA dehydrogenase family protein, partial [Chloroflexota bacterium]|nr:acyl-CoA dehydrogenase family protein [Chloroflexota bacterium]
MDFDLSSQQQEVRARAARMAREIVAPRAAQIDREARYPQDIFEAFRDEGLLGLAFPVELGGSGAGSLGLALAIEEVAKYCSASGLLLLTTRLATAAIEMAGTSHQREHYVRGVAEGRLRGAFALTEPEAGSDAASISTTARREDDEYVLNGV